MQNTKQPAGNPITILRIYAPNIRDFVVPRLLRRVGVGIQYLNIVMSTPDTAVLHRTVRTDRSVLCSCSPFWCLCIPGGALCSCSPFCCLCIPGGALSSCSPFWCLCMPGGALSSCSPFWCLCIPGGALSSCSPFCCLCIRVVPSVAAPFAIAVVPSTRCLRR